MRTRRGAEPRFERLTEIQSPEFDQALNSLADILI
jgi:hypothetical protein